MQRMFVLSCTLLSACLTGSMQTEAARVRVLDPRPLIDLPTHNQSLGLTFAPEVPDAFMVPEQNGVTPVPVEGGHATLTNGFKNGPGRFFADPAGRPPEYQVVLMTTALDYVPTAMFARGAPVTGAAAVVARLRYMARLVNAAGQVIGRAQGELISTQQWTQAGGSSTTCKEVVESMFVDLSKQLLSGSLSQ